MKKFEETLDKTHPELCKEWHPTKNTLGPSDVTAGSTKLVWWYLPYDDPRTGRHFNFEWQAVVYSRAGGRGCPFLSNKAIWPGFNDLETVNEDLAKEWHPTKNGSLTPRDVTIRSGQKVWWLLPYDDPRTGKHFDFEWQATIANRSAGDGCPFLFGKAIWIGFNDLESVNLELAREWHPTKNGNLTPRDVRPNSSKTVWWYLPYDDPRTGKHFNFEWQAKIVNRSNGYGCPFLSGQAIWIGFNDLKSVVPELAKEWHPTKNGKLTPQDVTPNSAKVIWWQCEKGHTWKASVDSRCHRGIKQNCPECVKEFKTSFPEQIIYYYIKTLFSDALNRDVDAIGSELDIYIPSIKVAIEYDGRAWHKDLNKDIAKNDLCKKNGIQMIRVRECGCPSMKKSDMCKVFSVKVRNEQSLTSAIVNIAFALNRCVDIDLNRDITEIRNLMEYTIKSNSLAALFPQIAKEWHPTKNGKLKPECVTAKSGKVVWWFLPYDDPRTGKHFDFEWQAAVGDRTRGSGKCPYLIGKMVMPGFNDLASLSPNIAAQWNYGKNKGLKTKRGKDISTPDKVTIGSEHNVWWMCERGHEWQSTIASRASGRGCPTCSKIRSQNKIA